MGGVNDENMHPKKVGTQLYTVTAKQDLTGAESGPNHPYIRTKISYQQNVHMDSAIPFWAQ